MLLLRLFPHVSADSLCGHTWFYTLINCATKAILQLNTQYLTCSLWRLLNVILTASLFRTAMTCPKWPLYLNLYSQHREKDSIWPCGEYLLKYADSAPEIKSCSKMKHHLKIIIIITVNKCMLFSFINRAYLFCGDLNMFWGTHISNLYMLLLEILWKCLSFYALYQQEVCPQVSNLCGVGCCWHTLKLNCFLF